MRNKFDKFNNCNSPRTRLGATLLRGSVCWAESRGSRAGTSCVPGRQKREKRKVLTFCSRKRREIPRPSRPHSLPIKSPFSLSTLPALAGTHTLSNQFSVALRYRRRELAASERTGVIFPCLSHGRTIYQPKHEKPPPTSACTIIQCKFFPAAVGGGESFRHDFFYIGGFDLKPRAPMPVFF